MSKNTVKATKNVSLTAEFMRAATLDPQGSLAYMILAAFGVTLAQCQAAVIKMVDSNDVPVMLFCITAGVQIRGNTVFVGPQFGNIRVNYPMLVIEGSRDVKDVFNFGACHVCGHILAELASDNLANQILKKSGSCVTGSFENESEAGIINSEIHKSFTSADKTAFANFHESFSGEKQHVIDAVFAAVPTMSTGFTAKLTTKPV